ncbi:MAG: polysaccharide biosynthesis/export family protein [Prevotellaceae bacterium]|nr:polysaccharide biosynthesis/export family protein [Prevotellaceae bacterium]MCD8303643.1 polysaccharide biosynthesis/export family protein [Prevotellaceae bacterium]
MKNSLKFAYSLLLVSLLASFSSCSISNKDFLYLQGADTLYAVPQDIKDAFELKIQPDDELAISIGSKNAELIEPFNNSFLVGGGARVSSSIAASANTTSRISYFLVDQLGDIDFPILGTIHVQGKTARQVAADIRDRLVVGNYILDASVLVRLQNTKITILGDVSNPGARSFDTDRLTILEAIGRAGDLKSTAKRSPILVIREQDGKRVSYQIDLRDPQSVYTSPAYYLQQNDVVYVQPNKTSRIRNSTGYTYLSVGSTILGLLVSIASIIIASD